MSRSSKRYRSDQPVYTSLRGAQILLSIIGIWLGSALPSHSAQQGQSCAGDTGTCTNNCLQRREQDLLDCRLQCVKAAPQGGYCFEVYQERPSSPSSADFDAPSIDTRLEQANRAQATADQANRNATNQLTEAQKQERERRLEQGAAEIRQRGIEQDAAATQRDMERVQEFTRRQWEQQQQVNQFIGGIMTGVFGGLGVGSRSAYSPSHQPPVAQRSHAPPPYLPPQPSPAPARGGAGRGGCPGAQLAVDQNCRPLH